VQASLPLTILSTCFWFDIFMLIFVSWNYIMSCYVMSSHHLLYNNHQVHQIPSDACQTTVSSHRLIYNNHHHQEWTPDWGMTDCKSLLQVFRLCARCQAEWRPMLHGFRSASTIQFNSINVFLKWPKWMSPQGPPREYILLNDEMSKWLLEYISF